MLAGTGLEGGAIYARLDPAAAGARVAYRAQHGIPSMTSRALGTDLEAALEQIEARVGQRSCLALLLVDEMRLVSACVCVHACSRVRVRLRARARVYGCLRASVCVRACVRLCVRACACAQADTYPVRGNFVRSCPGLCGTVGSLTARLANKS